MKRTISPLRLFIILFTLSLCSCGTTSEVINQPAEAQPLPQEILSDSENPEEKKDKSRIELLFAGDIMAHSVNYNISTYEKIWRDVRAQITEADLAFANIEAPIDTKKPASSYPNFNMTKKYVKAAVEGGFDIFSLCNNHTNDQYLEGIQETTVTMKQIAGEIEAEGGKVWFSGLKDGEKATYSYNIVEANGWKILFLPITELLNRPDYSSYINFVRPDASNRQSFVEFVKNLRKENPCDLFVLSVHTCEPEYTRVITEKQDNFYNQLLDAGVDILWANHAHIIKNRKVIVDTNGSDKLIMYACGNVISGQRTRPDFNARIPNGERDNTGDGLFYKVFLKKTTDGKIKLEKAEPFFITTYINTANEYIIKPLNQSFVDYLYEVERTDWAKYIEKRIKINYNDTKDLIEWR
ncbi:MAG: CapA family protein [Treponema sp.]|nr:CapA family protein [Treponema sp.]